MTILGESITDKKIAFKVYSEYKKTYISTFIIFLTEIIVLVFIILKTKAEGYESPIKPC